MHFQPKQGYVGDIIPFFWEGIYHAFYLLRRDGHLLAYAHAASRDLVHWEELPMALEPGGPDEPDTDGCWTGSVIERGGTFHLFYTGHVAKSAHYPSQSICHATSSDLVHWDKDPGNPLLLPDRRWYEDTDWRDPFVFWNADADCYWALISAREKGTATPRRGCIAVATSRDLEDWEAGPPLWTPFAVGVPECPDLFRMGDRWYLIYSTMETRYRTAPRIRGPWKACWEETLDGPRFYAAKTISDGKRRFLLGWLATREGETDEGKWEWGGLMATPRELSAAPDGSLAMSPNEGAVREFTDPALQSGEGSYAVRTGRWTQQEGWLVGCAPAGFGFLLFHERLDDFFVSFTVTVSGASGSAGLLLRMDDRLEAGYQLCLEPSRCRVALRAWNPYGDTTPLQDRPLPSRARRLRCQVFVQGSAIEVFVNDRVSLTYRLYQRAAGSFGLYVQNGSARFEHLTVVRGRGEFDQRRQAG